MVKEAKASAAPLQPSDAEAERRLGTIVGWLLPIASVGAAAVVGFLSGMGTAILVLTAGTLLGTIAIVWTSVRTLTGDAPLPEDMHALSQDDRGKPSALAEQRRMLVRALKDLEHERAIGRIDDADYAEISQNCRAQIKEIMRQEDEELAPLRARAEDLIDKHLGKARPITTEQPSKEEPKSDSTSTPDRLACASCSTSNERDAKFCKGCGGSLVQTEAS